MSLRLKKESRHADKLFEFVLETTVVIGRRSPAQSSLMTPIWELELHSNRAPRQRASEHIGSIPIGGQCRMINNTMSSRQRARRR